MNKTSSLPLFGAAIVATVVTLSAPAIAADSADTSFNDDLVRAALADRGIEATVLAENFNKIRATVTLPDGSTEFQYFDIDTLQPVGAGGGNSRVLSRLDVGAEPKAPSLNSLTWVDPDDL